MTEIPTAWLWISGIFFLCGILVCVAVVVVLLKLLQLMQAMQPKLSAMETSVQQLTTKLHSVADRVEEVAISVKTAVDGVGGKAKSVAGSAEIVATSASRQFERFSPLLVGALTAIRIVKAVSDARRPKLEPTKKKGSFLGSLFGR